MIRRVGTAQTIGKSTHTTGGVKLLPQLPEEAVHGCPLVGPCRFGGTG